ncbi:hypothetical protein RUM43_001457 [Polyplax serrata]|uniref:Uncharacterized protein n=1 Tax=Polyplax serrata TaxID=468196 RepID=A0AAN8SI38_POLSC
METLAFCLNINLYTFLANIELADSTLESAEDMTAADTAPNPKKETKSGVRVWYLCLFYSRVAFAIAPIKTGGMAMSMQPAAATYERTWALPAVLLDSTR